MESKQRELRVMIASGGTGGHVYPALAIAEALVEQCPEAALSFVGSVDGFERPLVAESNLKWASYDEVRAGPLHGVGLVRTIGSVFQLAAGTAQAFGLMLRRKPAVILQTGGWVGLPVALAAWVMRIPMMIYLPDIEPGLTIQVLKRFARRVALTLAESKVYFPTNETVVTGYPLRQVMLKATREAAVKHFGLDADRKTLLVFGGSRGSRAINNALLDVTPQLLASGIQVIHVTGTLDWADIEARLKTMGDLSGYHAFPYLHHEMGLAMAGADLVVSRSGASVLGEFPYFALPSILIPYPHAWRYQKVNADYLAERGAAIYLDEAKMAETLLPTVRDLLLDERRLGEMRESAKALAHPQAATRAAEELVRLVGGVG